MVPSKTFSHDTLTIGYRDGGEGKPLVVLGGWGFGSVMMEVALGELRNQGVRLITIDLPGTGVVEEASAFVHIPRLSSVVAALLRELGLNEVTVLGHAFGALVAQEMALSEDDVTARLILISTPAGGGVAPDLQTSMDMLSRLMTGEVGLLTYLFAPGYLSQLKRTLGQVFDELDRPAKCQVLSGQVWAASRWHTLGRIQNIYQPVLLLHGKNDPLSLPDWAGMLARSLPQATLQLLPCGYLPFVEKKAETLAAIGTFMGIAKKR